jgi:predicted permease
MTRWLRGFGTRGSVAAAAILSLAIGIGANTAIFSVANALLLRPLNYRDADRLAILWNRSPGLNIQEDWFSTAQYFDIKGGHSGFEDIAIALGANYNLTGVSSVAGVNDVEPERVGVIRVSSNLLPMLGARPAAGQLFVPEDDAPGRAGTAVLGHGFWMRRFGGDRGAIGQSIILNGQSYQIVGALPETFRLPREVLPTLGVAEDGEIFLPLPLPPTAPQTRTREDYNIIARLKPGVTVATAQAEMDALTARLRRDFPDFYPPQGGLTFSIVPLLDQVVGNVRGTVIVLMGAVAFVLLIACANVANLLLSRALARQRELSIRAALGATRAQIVGQLLGESVTLALVGGALGVALAWAGITWLRALQPTDVPRLADIGIDIRVLAFTMGVSVLVGVLAGLAPAFGLRRLDLQRTLGDASRGSAGARSMWGKGGHLRRILVVSQLALAVVLLIGAGLLVRTVAHLQHVPPGFSANNVLTMELTMTGQKYANGPAVLNAYKDLWDRLSRVAGVTNVGGVSSLPLSGYFSWGPITVEGRIPPPGENFINADQRIVGGRYFETMDIPLKSGRLFNDEDNTAAPRVVIVDEFMARELWPGADAVGKRIRFGDLKSTAPWQTVVGVVGRVKQYGLAQDGRIAVYLSQTQAPVRAMYITARAENGPDSIATAVRQQIREFDANLPIYRLRPMSALVDASLARHRFAMRLLTLFAILALVLAAIGTYAVMAFIVSQGTREMGIRLALGATPGGIIALVVRQGLSVALIGVVVGLAGAFALTRLLSTLIFGVSSTDPLTYAGVAAVLGGVAILASAVPARRASRIDPAISLRNE